MNNLSFGHQASHDIGVMGRVVPLAEGVEGDVGLPLSIQHPIGFLDRSHANAVHCVVAQGAFELFVTDTAITVHVKRQKQDSSSRFKPKSLHPCLNTQEKHNPCDPSVSIM